MKDKEGFTALHRACDNKNIPLEVIKNLIENKSNINLPTNTNKSTPLHLVTLHGDNFIHIFKFLIEKKAFINSVDKNGCTPLHLACSNGENSSEMINFLVKNKSNVDVINFSGSSPLILVCKNSNPVLENLKCLVENKANINLTQNGKN